MTSPQESRTFIVTDEDDGIRLDRWFKRNLADVTFNQVSRWARTGQLRIDGKRAGTKAGFAPATLTVPMPAGEGERRLDVPRRPPARRPRVRRALRDPHRRRAGRRLRHRIPRRRRSRRHRRPADAAALH